MKILCLVLMCQSTILYESGQRCVSLVSCGPKLSDLVYTFQYHSSLGVTIFTQFSEFHIREQWCLCTGNYCALVALKLFVVSARTNEGIIIILRASPARLQQYGQSRTK